ncbi:hypothetical protein F1188_13650 [Roseospira marina]|uniref:Uncharacterized protein n=1 Tax=Roseospira marina TaxID=140057 RepID=A0A5M6IAU8_9PROT|nr:hypothetical protein [Roseospira marina]KAA5604865.1 hypothetical protein F1188_13650 [Roseospira marina]MBB4315199.1 putative hemolysin [Roseospira marina]MBB5088199.1 putative hemolysin [Roseospira marina]
MPLTACRQPPAPAVRSAPHRRRTVPAVATAVAAALLLTACGAPFVDARREAGSTQTVGASSPDAPVVCYAKGETSPAEVAALANAVCAETGRAARFDSEDLLQCRLMQPWRAHFTCVAPDAPGAGTQPPGPGGRDSGRSPSFRGDSGGRNPADGSVYPGGHLPAPPRL